MELIEEKIFNIKYNEKRNVIEVIDKRNKLKVFFRKNKFMLSIIGTTTTLVAINIILIEQFYRLLLNL